MGINAYQAFLMIYFVRRRFHIVRPRPLFAFLAGGAIALCLSVDLFFDIPMIDAFVFLIPFGYTLWASDEKWYVGLLGNAMLMMAFVGVPNLMIRLFPKATEVSWSRIMSEMPLRVAFAVSDNIALMIVVFPLAHFGRRVRDVLSWMALIIFLILLVLNLVMVELLYGIRTHVSIDDTAFAAVSLCLLLSAVLALVLYEAMTANVNKRKETEAKLKTARMSQRHYQEMKDMYSYMASCQHDLKHRLALIEKLLSQGHMGKGRELYSHLAFPREQEFGTGNIAVDAVLTIKKLVMEKEGIAFVFQPYPLHEIPIEETSLCVLLSALLDNAIEAVRRIEDRRQSRFIRLKLARSWDVFFIVCENALTPDDSRRGGGGSHSSRWDDSGHGAGIESVCKIVDDAQGQCKFETREDVFRVDIALPFSKGK